MSETLQKTGSDLLIVDNSDRDWKVLRYLHDWCQISKSIDIATGYFEIGSLLALKDEWRKVDEIRILMGDEVSLRTHKAFEKGLATIKDVLNQSVESEKEKNDFLSGIPAIVEALKSGKIRCRVYRKEKFHAKAYITKARQEVIGSFGLVGSSNFTFPGLSENIELNVQLAGRQVVSLQAWYDKHWEEAEDVTPEILRIVERHIQEYSPFQVYAKALHELFEGHALTDAEWEKTESKIYPVLDHYQKEGYHSLLKIARMHRGGLLCDGVGLGKTFIGLMLIERLVMHDKKRVMLLVPKSGRVPVWERAIKTYLPHLMNGFLSFKIFNHTDLMREASPNGRNFPDEFQQMKEQADAVIIDEAHHFRNRGLLNDSRYWKLYELIGEKTVFLLTATPVNNHLTDFQHLVELFSRVERKDAFAGTLGIHNLPSHFQKLEKELRKITANSQAGPLFEVNQMEAEKVLFDDKLFRELVIQRSRSYAKESQIQNGATEAIFPKKQEPKIVEYSVKKTYGNLLQSLEAAFSRHEQLFSLAVYFPLSKWKGDPDATEVSEWNKNVQRQVVRLIRIQFLKRFESSIYAFENSCQTILLKLLAFIKKNNQTPSEIRNLERWQAQNSELLERVRARQSELKDEEEGEEADVADLGDEFLENFEVLDRKKFNVEEIFDETYADLNQLVKFLDELGRFTPEHDDKLQRLIKLLKTDPILSKHKVLIFTEFMSTARYLRRELEKAGIDGVDEIDSASKSDRSEAIQRFSPYYNGTSSKELKAASEKETRVLISTDVLAEGLNLQDATRLINYDLHWNPVRLMQRIGRVDRRLNPAIEKNLLKDHPDQQGLRGTVAYWNFLPPDDLDSLLRLYQRVSEKTLRISKVFGIEGKKLLHPEDDYDALKDFTHAYEGALSRMEQMHLDYQKLLADRAGLRDELEALPGRVFSGKAHIKPNCRAVFFCYGLPVEDKTAGEKSPSADSALWRNDGKTAWYLYDMTTEKIMDQPEEIIDFIRCAPDTPRRTLFATSDLRNIRLNVEKHIKNTYLKQVQAPMGANPSLLCWMEMN